MIVKKARERGGGVGTDGKKDLGKDRGKEEGEVRTTVLERKKIEKKKIDWRGEICRTGRVKNEKKKNSEGHQTRVGEKM